MFTPVPAKAPAAVARKNRIWSKVLTMLVPVEPSLTVPTVVEETVGGTGNGMLKLKLVGEVALPKESLAVMVTE